MNEKEALKSYIYMYEIPPEGVKAMEINIIETLALIANGKDIPYIKRPELSQITATDISHIPTESKDKGEALKKFVKDWLIKYKIGNKNKPKKVYVPTELTEKEIHNRRKSLACAIGSIMAQSLDDKSPHATVMFYDMVSKHQQGLANLEKEASSYQQLSDFLTTGYNVDSHDDALSEKQIMFAQLGKELIEAKQKVQLESVNEELSNYFDTYIKFMTQDPVKSFINADARRDTLMYTAESLVEKSNDKAMSLLIDKGFDIHQKDAKGTTLLDYAVDYNKPEMVELLINKGAKASPELIQKCQKSIARGTVIVGDIKDAAKLLLDKQKEKSWVDKIPTTSEKKHKSI